MSEELKIRKVIVIKNPEEAKKLLESLKKKEFVFRNLVEKYHNPEVTKERTRLNEYKFDGYSTSVELFRILEAFETGIRKFDDIGDVKELLRYLENSVWTIKNLIKGLESLET